MTYEEFMQIVADGIEQDVVSGVSYIKGNLVKTLESQYIGVEWRTGGMSGGSCWDDGDSDPHYPLSSEAEDPFNELDQILMLVAPSITFMQYKKLCADVVKYENYTNNEYYGNFTEYSVKTVDLKELHEWLVQNIL